MTAEGRTYFFLTAKGMGQMMAEKSVSSETRRAKHTGWCQLVYLARRAGGKGSYWSSRAASSEEKDTISEAQTRQGRGKPTYCHGGSELCVD